MERNLKQILSEIYSIDPGLKSKEAVLVKIIQELLAARPQNKINEEFVNNLRLKLITERSRLMELKPINNMFNILSKKIIFTGAAALSLITLVIFFTLQGDNGQLAIKDAGKEAFGELILNPSQGQAARESSGDAIQSPVKMDSPATAPLGLGGGGTAPGSAIAPYPYEITNYKYVYAGGEFELGSGQGDVYRRALGGTLGSQLATVVGRMDLGMVDLNKFQDMKVNTLEIAEDKEYGYSLYIDFRQNTLSINMNWEKWPARESAGQAAEMSNEEIVAVADKFLADYGINTKNYGKGEVQATQLYTIMKGESISDSAAPAFYARDYANVIYPMLINGEQVYDQSGQKYGIGLGIDLAYQRVTSAYNINTGAFESSTYDLETDVDKIIKFVESGGMYGNYFYPEATKTVVIEVGKPVKGLLMTWQWNSARFNSNELFVPALIFPIISQDGQADFYRTYITVPLTGELFNQNDIRPMPLEVKPAQ